MEEEAPLMGEACDQQGVTRSQSESSMMRNDADEVSVWSVVDLIRPYLWPESLKSRLSVTSTFAMVGCSKTCSVLAPLFLARAANALARTYENKTSVMMSISLDEYEEPLQHLKIYCLLCFLAVLCSELQTLIYMHVKQEANVVLCTKAYKHVLSLSVDWHISRKAGSTLRILERGGKSADELIGFLLLNFVPGLVECGFVCLLFVWKFHQVEIFIVAAMGILAYGSITRFITSQRKKLRKESNSYDNLYNELASDSFANIEQVKCCNGENFEVQRYSNAVFLYNKSRTYILSATGVLKISQQFIVSVTLFATLYITIKKVLEGKMNIGEFVAVHSYTIGMFTPLNSLGGNYNKIVQALVDVCQLAELMNEVPSVQNTGGEIPIPLLGNCRSSEDFQQPKLENGDVEMPPIHQLSTTPTQDISICFENVGFNYNSCIMSSEEESASVLCGGLDDVSFTVPSGTTTAIVGSSGSGKTTLSRMMFRFYDPSRGRILFNNYDIKEYTQESIRSCIGLVPQDTILFNNTILFNIKYGRLNGVSMKEVVAACKAAQILQFIENLPDKWDTVVGERGMKLSGGEKQRVAIARCLLRNPPVIVLDEATSSLDSETEKSVQLSLQSLTQSHRTVVIIAHRLSTIQSADQILVMDHGEIIQRGTHEQLLKDETGKYKILWDSQYREQTDSES